MIAKMFIPQLTQAPAEHTGHYPGELNKNHMNISIFLQETDKACDITPAVLGSSSLSLPELFKRKFPKHNWVGEDRNKLWHLFHSLLSFGLHYLWLFMGYDSFLRILK